MTDRTKSDYELGDTPANRKRAEELLSVARSMQTAFWDALSELEECLSEIAGDTVEVSGTRDLEDTDVEGLLEAEEDEEAQ